MTRPFMCALCGYTHYNQEGFCPMYQLPRKLSAKWDALWKRRAQKVHLSDQIDSNLVQVSFSAHDSYFWTYRAGKLKLKVGDFVLVDTQFGEDKIARVEQIGSDYIGPTRIVKNLLREAATYDEQLLHTGLSSSHLSSRYYCWATGEEIPSAAEYSPKGSSIRIFLNPRTAWMKNTFPKYKGRPTVWRLS